MLKVCRLNKTKVLEQINNKVLDAIVTSQSNLIDDIILSMKHEGVLDCLNAGFNDKRNKNRSIPLSIIMALAIAAKMKTKMSLTDIPYAIRDHRTLAELGYASFNLNLDEDILTEGTIRYLIDKYNSSDLVNYYNVVIQDYIFKENDICPNIHIMDCTKVKVNFENRNYENATIGYDHNTNQNFRGYKMSSLRGLIGDVGIIEEIRFGTASTHDIELSEELLKTSKCLHEGDILIMDRGFMSRSLIKYLKEQRKVEVYIPMKKNMSEYLMAVNLAEESDDWKPHPTRKNQMICHVPYVDALYEGWDIEDFVPMNAVVIWSEETQKYAVFTTTDLTVSANDIIRTYELRTEIEEDFRQIKDFWKLEDFTTTKFKMITFHIICTLFGYLFYQLYLTTKDGEKYIGKCLPVILKKYHEEFLEYLVLYSGKYFCTMSLKEFVEYSNNCSEDIQNYLLNFLK